MKESVMIAKEGPKDKGMDLTFLLQQGIEYIQEISGEEWTDYNIHDPGVTVLEYLCYGITDLSYKVNTPIEDFLFAPDRTPFDPNDNALFAPKDSLTSAPLTVPDYRRLFLDKLADQIENVWITPHQSIAGLQGLWAITIQPKAGFNQHQLVSLEQNIRNTYVACRQLGQDLAKVTILKPVEIGITAQIQLNYDAHAEAVLAGLLFDIEQLFSPPIAKKSIESEAIENESLFTGPKFQNHFISEADLTNPVTNYSLDLFRSLITKNNSVLAVQNLKAIKEDLIQHQNIIIDEGFYPILDKSFLFHPNIKCPIEFYKGDVNLSVDYNKVNILLTELVIRQQTDASSNFTKKSKKTKNRIAINDLKKYYSIQRLFPRVYGLGAWGLPARATVAQKAQTKQLKGFLALLESILAQQLNQLGQLKNLFSLSKLPQDSSLKIPEDIPDIYDLQENTNIVQRPSGNASFDSKKIEQKNKFIDHLMARFGLSFPPEQEKLLLNNHDHKSEKEQALMLLTLKMELLKQFPELSANRSIGINYEQKDKTSFTSPYQQRIALLIGINRPMQSIFAPLKANRFLSVKTQPSTPTQATKKIKVKDVLLHGMDTANYFFKEQEGVYDLYFKNPISQERVFLKKAEEKQTLLTFQKEFIEELRALNEACEGFHVLEHILLRARQQSRWQLNIIDEQTRKPILYSGAYSSYEELKLASINIFSLASNKANFQIMKNTKTKRFFFYLKDEDGIYFLKSAKSYAKEEIKAATLKIYEFFKHKKENSPETMSELIFLDKVISPYDLIEQDVFSNQISLFFPNWVARFQTMQHRQLIESIVQANTPVQLKVNFHWLSITKMAKFEKLYFAWIDQLQVPDAKPMEIDKCAFALLQFLNLAKN